MVPGRRVTKLAVERLGQQLRGLLSAFGVEEYDQAGEPHMATIRQTGPAGHPISGVQVLRPFGFYAIPADADSNGEPIAITIDGTSYVLAILDHRYPISDGDAGETGLHNAHGLRLRLCDDHFELNGGPLVIAQSAKASGFKTPDGDGAGVTVTYLKDLSGNTGTLTFSGGILISAT